MLGAAMCARQRLRASSIFCGEVGWGVFISFNSNSPSPLISVIIFRGYERTGRKQLDMLKRPELKRLNFVRGPRVGADHGTRNGCE